MIYMARIVVAVTVSLLLLPNASASITGHSLYNILTKGLSAAETINAQPAECAALKKLLFELKPVKNSSKAVQPAVEKEARLALSTLATSYGDTYKSAFFQAFGLPSATDIESQSYPRAGRVRMVAGFIAELRAEEKFDDAYRNKVIESADKKIYRPAEGETVTMYINKRKVSGPIRYHKNTFDIGIVTFPNEDLPNEYKLDLILTRKAEYLERHFTEKREAYVKKGTAKITDTALKAGNYVLLDGEWFAPDEACPALEYFLKPPEKDGSVNLKPVEVESVVRRIQEGNNSTTLAVANALLRFAADNTPKRPQNVLSPETYSKFLAYWKNSQASKNNPKVSEGLPLGDSPGDALYAAVLKFTVAMLMEP